MSTTSLFIEILIVGIQGLIWIVIALFGLNGIRIEDVNLTNGKDWLTLILPIFFSMSYTFGIIIDRLADGLCILFSPEKNLLKIAFFRKLKQKALANDKELINLKVKFKEGRLSDYFSYIKSRLRVLRGTTLNMLLITFSSLIYFLVHEAKNHLFFTSLFFCFIILILGLACSLICWISVALLELSYNQRQKEIEKLL